MATIKSYTDLSQSRRLAVILPPESADMGYLWNGTSFCEYPVSNKIIFNRVENIPCWSFVALFNVLPEYIGDYGKCLYYDTGRYYCGYMDDGNFMLTIQETKADNPIDACAEMILKLYELKIL